MDWITGKRKTGQRTAESYSAIDYKHFLLHYIITLEDVLDNISIGYSIQSFNWLFWDLLGFIMTNKPRQSGVLPLMSLLLLIVRSESRDKWNIFQGVSITGNAPLSFSFYSSLWTIMYCNHTLCNDICKA